MTDVRFPKRRGDGTFVVAARCSISDPEVLPLVDDYLQAWMKANSTWVRIWRSHVIWEERLDFYSDFLKNPSIEVDHEKRSFTIVFERRASATRWRDWTVYIVD